MAGLNKYYKSPVKRAATRMKMSPGKMKRLIRHNTFKQKWAGSHISQSFNKH